VIDAETLLRFAVALAIVLALIAGLAWLGKRPLGQNLRGGRRLRVVEATAIDGRSRLVLVRRDEREHLILVHPSGACVVETGIAPPAEPAQGKTA
jgi:flagellar protein FliO/FliZ